MHPSISFATLALTVSYDNPRYLANDYKNAIYLTGSHTWELIQLDDYKNQDIQKRFDTFLAYVQSFHHNFIRLWTNISYLQYEPKLWQQTEQNFCGNSNPQYDLKRFNQQYFDTLKECIQKIQDADMYCSVMFFGSFNGIRKQWSQTVWHPQNNINPEISKVFSEEDHRSFCTTAPEVLDIQRALVRKTIDTLNDFDNIIWEIINEQGGKDKVCVNWQKEIVDYVKQYEATKPKQHIVGMTGGYALGENMLTGNHDWISPDLYRLGYYEGGPSKNPGYVVISDTDHIRNSTNDGRGFSEPRFAEDMRKWVWKTFLRGNNPIFMDSFDDCVNEDPEAGEIHGEINPVFDEVRHAMGETRRYTERFFDLAKMIPSKTICSTGYFA